MFNDIRTQELFGYSVDSLSEGSHKKIVTNCDICGDERICQRRSYHNGLCHACAVHTSEFKKNVSEAQKKRFEDSEQRDMLRQSAIDYWSDPKNREMESKAKLELHKINPELAKNHSKTLIQLNKDNPELGKQHSIIMKSLCSDPEYIAKLCVVQHDYALNHPEKAERQSRVLIQLNKDNPELAKRHSAAMQGQDYDAGEWDDFVDYNRKHLEPETRCVKINQRFVGCEGHHITQSLMVYIPAKLHRHIGHNLKTGKGMAEINMIALQYINGCYD